MIDIRTGKELMESYEKGEIKEEEMVRLLAKLEEKDFVIPDFLKNKVAVFKKEVDSGEKMVIM